MIMKRCIFGHLSRNYYRLDSLASAQEVLVPIRLEFDINGFKVNDQFTWNLNGSRMNNIEHMISIEKFAEYICTDLDLNPQHYVPLVARNVRSQIEEYKRFYQTSDVPIPEDTRIMMTVFCY